MTKSQSIPELADVAKKHTVEALEAKLDKCYTSEKYKEFQTEVEAISLKQLGGDVAHLALDSYLETRVVKIIETRGWRNKTFWIPTGIAFIAAIAAVIALFR